MISQIEKRKRIYMMFKVKGRFEQTEQTITVYAVKKKGCMTLFLIYDKRWKWEDADEFIPVEE